MPTRPALAGALLALALLAPGRVGAEEWYFVLVFSSQRVPNNPRYSHSFATFVKAVGAPAAGYRLEAHTISWLPRTMDLRVLTLVPECGRNVDLHATLRWAYAEGQRVSLWGPYQVRPELYARALAQIALLESGKVDYKLIDAGYPTDRASNCVHAVAAVAEGYRAHVADLRWGDAAGEHLMRQFEPWLVCPRQVYPWVRSGLGLDAYPLAGRDLPPSRVPAGGRVPAAALANQRVPAAAYYPAR